MVIKWSPGGEWGRQLRNPPVYFRRDHGEFFFSGLRRLMIAATDLLSQETFTFSKLIANYGSLACTCLKAVSVPYRRACAFVIGGLRGFMHMCLLSKTFHLNRWKTKIICSRKTNLGAEKVLSKNKQTQNLTKVYRTTELHLRLQRSDVSFHCPLARHVRAYEPLALSYPTSQLMRTVAGLWYCAVFSLITCDPATKGLPQYTAAPKRQTEITRWSGRNRQKSFKWEVLAWVQHSSTWEELDKFKCLEAKCREKPWKII